MTLGNPKYDVAISFLTEDLALASALHDKLCEGLDVFFFPGRQEVLAGTDGLESMREPFLQSRINLVVYREQWGQTPWTRVEAAAIKDACLENGFENLFFLVVDSTNVFPKWLPRTHVRFNYKDFSLEQAIGAIKARVQERGGQFKPLTAMRRAEIYKADEEFRLEKLGMSSAEGMHKIFENVVLLFGTIEQLCLEINAQGHIQIECGSAVRERDRTQTCVMTDNRVGININWFQQYSNLLDNASLSVREVNGGLILPKDFGLRVYWEEPKLIRETKYKPQLSRTGEYGWGKDEKSDFLSSPVLAERCVIRFMDIAKLT